MKKVNGFLFFLAAIFVLCTTSLNIRTQAAELLNNSYQYRWAHTYINANGDVKKCRVKVNGDNVSNDQSVAYSEAVYHWNNLRSLNNFGYYNDKVYIYNVDFENSKLDFFSKQPSSGHWIYLPAYSNYYAVTCHKSTSAAWLINQNNGNQGSFTTGGSISYCRIFMKNFATDGSAYRFGQYIMRHEIGHVLGMGHYIGNSIMVPSYQENLYKVCIYDRDVLQAFYPNP